MKCPRCGGDGAYQGGAVALVQSHPIWNERGDLIGWTKIPSTSNWVCAQGHRWTTSNGEDNDNGSLQVARHYGPDGDRSH